MKRNFPLIAVILATTATIADAQTIAPSDAQAQAAALLSGPHANAIVKADARSLPSPASAVFDAHESAAALLSGARPRHRMNTVAALAESSRTRASMDAQAQAAALLSGFRSSPSRTRPVGGD